MFKIALIACTAALSLGAHAQSVTLLNEGFDSNTTVLAGKGWVFTNNSNPVGSIAEGWFQGDATFTGQSGGIGSYIGSSYNAASTAGGASLASWLISPSFSTYASGSVSFYARADILANYSDSIRYGLNSTGSTAVSSFSLSPTTTLGGAWTQYTVNFAGTGNASSMARFAVEYVGNADTSNYIGVDSVLVTASSAVPPVPEPSTYALMGLGLAGLLLGRRSIVAKAAR